jgi:CheY-like chemotaxis protein
MSSILRGRKIAIGVADSSFRNALRRTLEREGAAVQASDEAAALLESLPSQIPDVCIIDVDLPDLGPAELAVRVRDHGAIPIVLVSAHLFPSDSPSLKDLPTLPLPFSRRQLLEVLERAFRGKAA